MQNENNSYRIRTNVGNDSPNVLNVKLNQTFEFLNILSLHIGQKNLYKMPASAYGIVCGRVLLGGKSFGIQNAKVSIFIPKDSTVFDVKDDVLYAYSSVDSINYDGIRYNLLPSHVDNACHQNVGTMFEKEYVLDNNDVIRIFDSYYTYTTTTNNAGDYFIYGVPVGQHTLHVDVDLSDIGKLSVRPHDMIGQGYTIDQFESPNKFKADKNLNILPQIKSQNKPIYIYPFWGDTSEDDTNALITRCDIEIDYKFEPTAVFIGSIVTDKGGNAVSHKCIADDKCGKMSDLITGEGVIEMIRKTFDGKVEQFSVKGNRLIDGDGVWCYQVPMNLDYVCMDEFGNIVPTDNPEKGIPTRARVRFRISMDENPIDDSAKKRARFLVPNNPRLIQTEYPSFCKTHEADYEFGTFTRDESYCDMFWNDVYTVKSYIPRLQKRVTSKVKKFTGIKSTNHAGDNNPMPYNNLSIKMGFMYRFLCVILTIFLCFAWLFNTVFGAIGIVMLYVGEVLYGISDWIRNHLCARIGISHFSIRVCLPPGLGLIADAFGYIGSALIILGIKPVIKLSSDFCDDGGTPKTYVLGEEHIMGKWGRKAKSICSKWSDDISLLGIAITDDCNTLNSGELTSDLDTLLNCVQNSLAQDNEVTSFNFHNDWINGVLYAPMWYRKIKPKRRILFGLITVGGQDDWCDGNSSDMAGAGFFRSRGLKLFQPCAQKRTLGDGGVEITPIRNSKPKELPFNMFGLFSGYRPTTENDLNCYGYKCHNRSIGLFNVENGIIIRKETKYGEYVYYYKSVEYEDGNFKNILTGESGEVKILFATDIILLGSLNDCDEKGIPQFFKHLSETTYNMPPDLMSLSWNVDLTRIREGDVQGENIDETNAIDPNSVITELSGADYGNAGRDQYYDPSDRATRYTKIGGNRCDNGGLFYDLNCNFSFVKPKCCVNLSRICEFGVSLDQSKTFNVNGQEIIMPPDGFISYDEMYNPDARSMFATMNGNRLRTKIDPLTGFPTYDFTYLYIDNFDGTLANLMNDHSGCGQELKYSLQSYNNNFKLENKSASYMRFRYGYDPNIFKVSFYNFQPSSSLTLFSFSGGFPRYENSFYFYFGLKSGKTAIDKFRNQFYAECTNDAEAQSSVYVEYAPNDWCKDQYQEQHNGYVSFDLSNLDKPCVIEFNERSGNNQIDRLYTDIYQDKIYIGNTNLTLENDGFVQFLGTQGTLYNGYYTITITDANGQMYEQRMLLEPPKLTYSVSDTAFTMTDSELMSSGIYNSYVDILNAPAQTSQNNNYIRQIGGYITVSDLVDNGVPINDNFAIYLYINGTIPGFNSDTPISTYRVCGGVVSEVVYGGSNGILSSIDGEYVFAVPKPNEEYKIIVTQLCDPLCEENNNSVESIVYVSEPKPFKMFVNGVDSDLLKNFKTGYIRIASDIINEPYNGYSPTIGVQTGQNEVYGWLDIDNIGYNVFQAYPEEGQPPLQYSQIASIITSLENGNYSGPYNFSDEYYFEESDVDISLDYYPDIPLVDSSNSDEISKYILVPARIIDSNITDPFDERNYVCVFDDVTNQYIALLDGNNDFVENITVQQYFDTGDFYAQYQVISVINDIIQKRIDLRNSMIEAFWMYDNNDVNKTVNISYQTLETPVKTLVAYIPDEETNTRTGNGNPYILLDSNMEENNITSFSIPTISCIFNNRVPNNPNEATTIFSDRANPSSSFPYKMPPYCAIMDRMGNTRPTDVGQEPFYKRTVADAMHDIVSPDKMETLFGFHVIDKRPFTHTNIWIPINDWAIYWPDINGQSDPDRADGFVEGGFMNMNGCISGYFYNGFSTSDTIEADFTTQKVGRDIDIFTLTNVNGEPDEYAVPTKRLLCAKETDYPNDYQYTYNDFIAPISSFADGFDLDDVSLIGQTIFDRTRYRYISFDKTTNKMVITDERTSFSEKLYSNGRFGIEEDTVITYDTLLNDVIVFEGMGNTPVQYSVIIDRVENNNIERAYTKNPVYQRVYDIIDYSLPSNNYSLNMCFNSNLPVNLAGPLVNIRFDRIPQTIGSDIVKSVFIVGFTQDGKYRGISPTYEVSPINIRLQWYPDHGNRQNPQNSTGWYVYLDFSDLEQNGHYIKNYEFEIIAQSVNNTTGAYEEFTTGLVTAPQTPTQNAEYALVVLNGNDRNVNNFYRDTEFYIKDVTGVRRRAHYNWITP